MKRSELKRKTPLRKTGGRMKRKGRKKPKAASYYDSIKEDRNNWKASIEQRCWWCGRYEHELQLPSRLEINEITPRSAAPNRWWHRCNGSLVCTSCHEQYGHAASDLQWLARKQRFDREHYDLQEWLRMRNPRAMSFIVQREVDVEVKRQEAMGWSF